MAITKINEMNDTLDKVYMTFFRLCTKGCIDFSKVDKLVEEGLILDLDEALKHLDMLRIVNRDKALHVTCKETGEFICMVDSIEQGIDIINAYESVDRKCGTYTPNFYDIVNLNHESVLDNQ